MSSLFYICLGIGAIFTVVGILEIINRKCYYQNAAKHTKQELHKFSLFDGISQLLIGIAIFLVAAIPYSFQWFGYIAMVFSMAAVFLHVFFKNRIFKSSSRKKKNLSR